MILFIFDVEPKAFLNKLIMCFKLLPRLGFKNFLLFGV
jgi:hypothetical protein